MSLTACAGMNAQQTTTSTLLTLHDSIVTIETGIKVPCENGIIPASDCASIENYILQAKPAYNAAADAQILALQSTSPANTAAYNAQFTTLNNLIIEATTLAVKYSIPTKSK